MRRFTTCAAAGLLLALSAPALGQGMDFPQIFAGKEVPHSLKLKDLSADWRRAVLHTADGAQGGGNDMMSQLMQIGMMSEVGKDGKGGPDAAGAMMGMAMMSSLFGGGGMMGGGGGAEPVYYTKGQTVSVGGETFLVAYRPEKKEVNFMQMAMEAEKNGGKEPDFAKMMAGQKLTPESDLALALVNVKSLGSIAGLRPFDMHREIEESGKSGGGLMDLFALAGAGKEQGGGGDAAGVVSQVKFALEFDDLLSAPGNTVEVSVADKVVTLKGTVTTPRLKQRATNLTNTAIKEAGGGFTVSNQIVVKPAGDGQ